MPYEVDASANSDELGKTESSSNERESEGGMTTGERVATNTGIVIAGQETKSVARLKLVVLAVFIGSALGVAVTTYLYLSDLERAQFARQFEDDSNKVLEAIGKSLDKTLGLLDGIAVAFVSHAKARKQEWPFVVLPDFALQMAKTLSLSVAISVNVSPLVKPNQREDWEAYSVAHDDWVDQSMGIQESSGHFVGPFKYSGLRNPTVHDDFGDVPRNTSRIMLPGWQSFPVMANDSHTYNRDHLATNDARPFEICLKKHKAVVVPLVIPTHDSALELENRPDFNLIPQDEHRDAPIGKIVYPIVDETSRVWVAGANEYDPNNHSAVATIAIDFSWHSLTRNILPRDSNGIHLVVSNPCADPFTYLINGPRSEFMGVGDHHERKHDSAGISSKLRNLGEFSERDSAYSGAKLDDEFCQATLTLYPSEAMRRRFVTNTPVIFSVGVILIFAFSLLVFYHFDRNVERRQETVMKTALRSSAIVSDLFPASVRDQLYPEDQEVEAKPNGLRKSQSEASAGDNESDQFSVPNTGSTVVPGTSPIAELYNDTTVLFADIVGFTAWSSARSPTQVFQLLETLYGGFDFLARRRGVFKIETIGDCYVAVVGLPKPNRQHAIVMARFANDCLKKMSELTLELATTLGVETVDLALRIGLNSGSTMAGVLRGEKSRFQLFGDTVNTAARMESTGERNKIHVSQRTAELIALGGKGHWLTERRDQVDCKDKGKITTFWCEPTSSSTMLYTDDAASVDASTVESCPVLPRNEPNSKAWYRGSGRGSGALSSRSFSISSLFGHVDERSGGAVTDGPLFDPDEAEAASEFEITC